METLKRLREKRQLSQVKLAARADLNPATVNQIERGMRNASPGTLRKLADALGVSLYELMEEEAPKVRSHSSTESPDESEGERLLEQRVRRLIADMEEDVEWWDSVALAGEVKLDEYKELKARQVSVQSSANALDIMAKTLGVHLSNPQYRTLQQARQDLQAAHSRWHAARKKLIDLHFSSRTEGELAEKRAQREEEEERLEEESRNNQWFSDAV